MEQLFISPYLLGMLFFVAAAAYASSGLGGGTTYTALLAVFGASHRAIPPVSLTMNIVVTLMGTFNYLREGHGKLRLIGPTLAVSVPMAYLGAYIDVEPSVFYPVLIAVLVAVAARIFVWPNIRLEPAWSKRAKLVAILGLSSIIGFLSGMIGIGGGIFLVPLLVAFGLADVREAAATGAVFILVNSLAGIGGHLRHFAFDVADIAPLVIAVALGGFAGSRLGAVHLRRTTIQRVMGGIVLIAAILLTLRLL